MRQFTDSKQRVWTVSLNVASVKNVRESLDINLMAIADDHFALLQRLTSDPVLLVAVLYVVCSDQAATDGVDEVDFGRAMAGDAICDAADALAWAVVDFFPDPRRRELLTKVLTKGRELSELMLTAAQQQAKALEQIDLQLVAKQLTDSFGDAPESSA